ncbi:40S ribosomal protein S27-B [Ranunculus cassubicifolius]
MMGRPSRSLIVLMKRRRRRRRSPSSSSHGARRLVQSPNSFFMDVKGQCCFNISQSYFSLDNATVFSHSQTVVVSGNCQTVLCQPTGKRARLTKGCSFRKKGD